MWLHACAAPDWARAASPPCRMGWEPIGSGVGCCGLEVGCELASVVVVGLRLREMRLEIWLSCANDCSEPSMLLTALVMLWT